MVGTSKRIFAGSLQKDGALSLNPSTDTKATRNKPSIQKTKELVNSTAIPRRGEERKHIMDNMMCNCADDTSTGNSRESRDEERGAQETTNETPTSNSQGHDGLENRVASESSGEYEEVELSLIDSICSNDGGGAASDECTTTKNAGAIAAAASQKGIAAADRDSSDTVFERVENYVRRNGEIMQCNSLIELDEDGNPKPIDRIEERGKSEQDGLDKREQSDLSYEYEEVEIRMMDSICTDVGGGMANEQGTATKTQQGKSEQDGLEHRVPSDSSYEYKEVEITMMESMCTDIGGGMANEQGIATKTQQGKSEQDGLEHRVPSDSSYEYKEVEITMMESMCTGIGGGMANERGTATKTQQGKSEQDGLERRAPSDSSYEYKEVEITMMESMCTDIGGGMANEQGPATKNQGADDADALDTVFGHVENYACGPGKTTRDQERKQPEPTMEKDVLDHMFESLEGWACQEGAVNGKKPLASAMVCRDNSLLTFSTEDEELETIQERVLDRGKTKVDIEHGEDMFELGYITPSQDESVSKCYKSRRIFVLGWIFLFFLASGLVAVGVLLVLGNAQSQGAVTLTPTNGTPKDPVPPPEEAIIIADICREAVTLENGSARAVSQVVDSTVDAYRAPSDLPTCGDVRINGAGKWYRMIGDGSVFQASTCGDNTDFDTQISVFHGSCDSLSCVGGNDNYCNDQSQVTWFAVTGAEYFVVVHGFRSLVGTFELTVKRVEEDELNDTCQKSSNIDFHTMAGSTQSLIGTNSSGNITCQNTMRASGLWYSWMGTGRHVSFSTCNEGTDYGAEISIFSGDSCDDLQCLSNNETSAKACNGNGQNVEFASELNVEYHVLVHQSADIPETGSFELTVRGDPPSNRDFETCPGSLEVQPSPYTQLGLLRPESLVSREKENATFDGICGGSHVDWDSPKAWYTVTGTGNVLNATTCDPYTTFDTQITVLTGNCDNLRCVAGNDQFSSCGDKSLVAWHSKNDEIYHVVVHGFGTRTGTFGFRLEETVDDWV